jgi:hypothetical protein
MWHVDPLLGGGREIGYCTAAVARQKSANNSRGTVFSARTAKQQLDTTIMGSANRHERNNGTQQRNGVYYSVRAEVL